MPDLFAPCPLHTEDLLEKELIEFGAANTKVRPAGVSFKGELETAYRACLWSRIASRVILKIDEFSITNETELAEHLSKINWAAQFDVTSTFLVKAVIQGKAVFHNSQYLGLKTKDAIADWFRQKTGERPSVDKEEPGILINVFHTGETISIGIDLTGGALHKRGYRKEQGRASIKENVAAAILYRSGWPDICYKGGSFIDPMCGSGTLVLEAAQVAYDMAPGLYRGRYGFTSWRGHDAALWESLLQEAKQRAHDGLTSFTGHIRGYDINRKAIKGCRKNTTHLAGLEARVKFEEVDFRNLAKTDIDTATMGLVCTNPPYGERLDHFTHLEQLYSELGLKMFELFRGFRFSWITDTDELSYATGFRAEKVHSLFNGPIKCLVAQTTLVEENRLKKDSHVQKPFEPRSESESAFFNRLKKKLKQTRKWAKKNTISSYRVYDADLLDYNVAIDFYENQWVHVQEYAPPQKVEARLAEKRMKIVRLAIPAVFDVDSSCIFIKTREKKKRKAQYNQLDQKKDFKEIRENQCSYLVNFSDYLDTGVFLDHRNVRAHIRENSKNKRFLNLFCYTATATVQAVAGGARASVSVDSSRNYLEWAKENFTLNKIDLKKHILMRADVMEYLSTCREQFDIILLDPPTFSNSKSREKIFDIQQDHPDLLRKCMNLLSAKGLLVFSNNFKKFKIDNEIMERYQPVEMTGQTIPFDFSQGKPIHRCWFFHK